MQVSPSPIARPLDVRPSVPAPRATPRDDRPPDQGVVVDLSPEALEALAEEKARALEEAELQARLPQVRREAEEEQRALDEQRALLSGEKLSEGEEEHLRELQRADHEVRTHEAGHLAAAGGLAGSLQLTTVTGADGRQYAVGGSVKIDVSDAGSPEANEAKMRKVKAAALAVANPSMADFGVAGRAERRLQKAIQARAARRYEENAERFAGAGPRPEEAAAKGSPATR